MPLCDKFYKLLDYNFDKECFLESIDRKVNKEFKRLNDAKEQATKEEMLKNIRLVIQRKCEIHLDWVKLEKIKTSSVTVDLALLKNELAKPNFPISTFLIVTYLYNKKLSKKQDRKKIDATIHIILLIGVVASSATGQMPSALICASLLFLYSPVRSLYDKHQIKKMLYADLPLAYKNCIDCELSQRNIEIYPNDTLKDVLEKTMNYEKYQIKRSKKIKKALSKYGLANQHSIFSKRDNPEKTLIEKTILEYAIDTETPLVRPTLN